MAIVLTNIPFKFDRRFFFDRVHVKPGSEDGDDLDALIEAVLPAIRPKAVYDVCFIDGRDNETVRVGDVRFRSRALSANLEGIARIFPYVATCGREIDQVPLPTTNFLAPYWLDALKDLALDAARRYLREHVSSRYATGELSSMAPGAGPADMWPIEQQRDLFALLGDVEGLVGVRLTESLLMIPNKSVSGILFPREVRFETCQVCSRESCPNRRAPYDSRIAASMRGA